jgi:hypothetical protein
MPNEDNAFPGLGKPDVLKLLKKHSEKRERLNIFTHLLCNPKHFAIFASIIKQKERL